MLVIPFSKQAIANVVLALLFITSEVLLVSAFTTYVNLYVSRNLRASRKHHPFSIRLYRELVHAANIVSFLVFIVLEILLTFTSVRSTRSEIVSSQCLRTIIPRPPFSSEIVGPAAESLHFSCTELDNTTVRHSQGRRSLSGKFAFTSCEKEYSYEYTIGKSLNHSDDLGKLYFGCINRSCAAALWQPDESGTSGTFYISGPADNGTKGMKLLPTKIQRNGERIQNRMQEIADELAYLLLIGSNEEGEVRRRLLTGVKEDECEFEANTIPVTEVKSWAVWLGGSVWVISVVLGVLGLFYKRKVLFDMGNGEHWAEKTRYGEEKEHGNRLGVEAREDGLVWVVSFDTDEDEINPIH